MKKAILLCGALLALTASVAGAAGLNLYWGGCSPNADAPVSATNLTNPCTSSSGTAGVMVASYVAPAGIEALSGIELVLDLQSAGTTLPAWWDYFNQGACRQNSLGANSVFPVNSGTCEDAWQGASSLGGLAAYSRATGPNRARMIIGWAVPPAQTQALTEGLEYFASNISVNRALSTGATACAGCAEPVCVVLNSILLAQPVGTPGGDIKVDTPANSQFVTYQGGVINGGCPGATPVRGNTWGAVKSLYNN